MVAQTHGWSNYLNRGSTASSEELGRKHSRSQIEANRLIFNENKICADVGDNYIVGGQHYCSL